MKNNCYNWQYDHRNSTHCWTCLFKDKALSKKTIKSGFKATGICPYDPNIFDEVDYIKVVEANKEAIAADNDLPEEERQQIVLIDALDVVLQEKVPTPEPPPSRPSTSMSMSTASSELCFNFRRNWTCTTWCRNHETEVLSR